jgi:hypothetical protein
MLITYYNKVNIHGYYEGIGAQYQRIIALLSIAKRHNIKYIHIPIKVGHNYNNDPKWNEKWDNMFNIKKLSNNNEIDLKNIRNKYSIFTDFTLDQLLNDDETLLYHYLSPFNIFDNNADYYLSNIQNDIIAAYDDINSTRKLIYNKNKINIAIHLRVFNKKDDIENYDDYINNKNSRHFMTCDMYITYIETLKNKYPNSDIHIFSQKDTFDIHYKKLYDIENIKIHFDELDTFDTFHHLCKADVFAMGSSSFSILAAFYNKNTIIYLPYSHPPSLKSWVTYNPTTNEILEK